MLRYIGICLTFILLAGASTNSYSQFEIIEVIQDYGNLTEAITSKSFSNAGYDEINMQFNSNNGLDHVLIKRENGNIVDLKIGDSKPMSKESKISLGISDRDGNRPMTDAWIERALGDTIKGGSPDQKNLAEEILIFIGNAKLDDSLKYEKFVSAIDKSTGELVVVAVINKP